MSRLYQHDMLAKPTHDEIARQSFVLAFKGHLGKKLRPATKTLYEQKVAPALTEALGRDPSKQDIRPAMEAEPLYRWWSSLNRAAQDQMWSSVSQTVEREHPRMQQAARSIEASNKKGSLSLDPDLEVPRYITGLWIHGQPGGYALDRDGEDYAAGALYESGGNLYSMGGGISRYESKAHRVMALLKERFPDLKIGRMLDMGCSAGGASVPYALELPETEVHAIDACPGMLRYAHYRAESIGAPVHFHQMNAEGTGFPDGHFDLVVSHNMMHETSRRALPRIMAESWRLVRPGGVVVHQDVPIQARNQSTFDQFLMDWETRYNNEPFWTTFAEMNVPELLVAGGAPEDAVNETYLKTEGSPIPWYIVTARKPN